VLYKLYYNYYCTLNVLVINLCNVCQLQRRSTIFTNATNLEKEESWMRTQTINPIISINLISVNLFCDLCSDTDSRPVVAKCLTLSQNST
jgi:hypothetical protein